jgi:hypothetical protein
LLSLTPSESWFDKVFSGLGDELARTIRDGARELEYLAKILDFVSNSKSAVVLGDLVPALQGVSSAAVETDGTLLGAADRLRDFAESSKGVFSADVEAAFQDLIAQLLEGKGTAEMTPNSILWWGKSRVSLLGFFSFAMPLARRMLRPQMSPPTWAGCRAGDSSANSLVQTSRRTALPGAPYGPHRRGVVAAEAASPLAKNMRTLSPTCGSASNISSRRRRSLLLSTR